MLLSLGAALGVAGVACSSSKEPTSYVIPAPDGGRGPSPQTPPATADGEQTLTKLTVKGRVTASGIDIVGRCGTKPPVSTQSDVNGNYALTADVADCSPLVIEYTRESFLPNLRVIPLPPPASPLVLNVALSEAKRVDCGTRFCKTPNDEFLATPESIAPAKRGWVSSVSGMQATDALPGELKDTAGQPIILFGFDYSQFFDANGTSVEKFSSPVEFIIPLSTEAERKNIGDVRRDTDDAIEMHRYSLDKATGRWAKADDFALVYFQWPCQPTDVAVPLRPRVLARSNGSDETYSAATRAQLEDIRADLLEVNCGAQVRKVTKYVIVAAEAGAGFHAWGISAPHKSCFLLNVKDACGKPVAGATLVSRGRFQPLRAENFTSKKGVACIDAILSEPECKKDGGIASNPDECDYNYNNLGGELFWLNIEVSHPTLSPARTFEQQELPRKEASCANPDACLHLEHIFAADCRAP